MWYEDFLEEYNLGRLKPGTDKGETVCNYNKDAVPKPEDVVEFIPVDSFYQCLRAWFTSDKGKEALSDIAWTVDKDPTSEIKGWRQRIIPNKISDQATDGPKYLDATRDLEK